jgi:septal ring factor EnvC (AmiA/AmiB activator)
MLVSTHTFHSTSEMSACNNQQEWLQHPLCSAYAPAPVHLAVNLSPPVSLHMLLLLLLIMTTQAHSQESQLEFAHQQLDDRQQELNAKQQELNARQQELNATLRGASDTERCARAANEQLADQVDALKQELNATRRELDTGEAGAQHNAVQLVP